MIRVVIDMRECESLKFNSEGIIFNDQALLIIPDGDTSHLEEALAGLRDEFAKQMKGTDEDQMEFDFTK